MHAVRTGAGDPLVLVHGLGSSSRNWDPVRPALTARREVIALDLPGFAGQPPVEGDVTIASLTDALQQWLADEGLTDAAVVGSSMGARMVLELARRGHRGPIVSLDPGGFWTDLQAKAFGASIKASVALVRGIQPALPTLTGNPVGRTALLAQFSAATAREMFPGARLHWFDKCGHFPHWDQPEQAAALILDSTP